MDQAFRSTTSAERGDHEAILDLIAAEQADRTRGIAYLGEHLVGVEAELADLEPPWASTVRIAREGDRIIGAALAECDLEVGRAWIFGPWVSGDDEAWRRWSRPLVDAALEQLPAEIDDLELSADVANLRLAALAAELNWPPTEVNHVFVANGESAQGWPSDDVRVRPVRAGDATRLAPLHDLEFPRTYTTADQLISKAVQGGEGTWTVLVAEDDGAFLGYAAGRLQPDGEGYLDFVAVPAEARGKGLGEALVTTIGRRLIDASPAGTVNLTVQDSRLAARRLYEKLGFRLEISIRGYRAARQTQDGQ